MACAASDNSSGDRRLQPRDDPARTAHHDAIYTLARASHLHDTATGDHVLRIRMLVECIGGACGLDEDDAESLGYDAMLHDVGKLMVPAEILRKPTPLTPAETEIMHSHTLLGAGLLADRSSMKRAALIARGHHEWFDGSGYPDALAGDAIPMAARITAAADVFDALLSRRSYKPPWPHEQAINEILALAGRQLDPDVVEAMRCCDVELRRLQDEWRRDASIDPAA